MALPGTSRHKAFSTVLISSLFCLLALATVATAAGPPKPDFYARRDYVGLSAYWVGVADINRDGIPDLVANASGYTQVLFGNGNGTFRPGANSDVVASSINSSVLTDLNGDGKVDLVQAGTGPGAYPSPQGIGVSLGNGDGTFQYGVFYEVLDSGFGGGLVLGDFNGDGMPDVAATGASGVWLFTGNGNGTSIRGCWLSRCQPQLAESQRPTSMATTKWTWW